MCPSIFVMENYQFCLDAYTDRLLYISIGETIAAGNALRRWYFLVLASLNI